MTDTDILNAINAAVTPLTQRLDDLTNRVTTLEKAGVSPPPPPGPPPPPAPSVVLFTDTFTTQNPIWVVAGVGGKWVWMNGGVTQINDIGDPKKLIYNGPVPPAHGITVDVIIPTDSWKGGDLCRAGIGLMTGPDGTGYNVLFHNDQNTVQFLYDHVSWSFKVPFTWQLGIPYTFRMATDGRGNYYAKIWDKSTTQPTNWMWQWVDTHRTTGQPAFNGGSGGCSVTFKNCIIEDMTGVSFVVTAPVSPPPPPPAPYVLLNPGLPTDKFQLYVYARGVNATQQQQILDAAAHWMSIIRAPLSKAIYNDLTHYGLVVHIDVKPIDGSGGILGSSGPDAYRSSTDPNPMLPTHATMVFDSADTGTAFATVVLHELGHCLGFGTIWMPLGLLKNPGTADPRFTGVNGTREYNTLFGVNEIGVPIEGGTLQGTSNCHLSESVFHSELMTGWLSGSSQPISRITIGVMQDMGYTVDYTPADAYAPGQLREGAGEPIRCTCLSHPKPELAQYMPQCVEVQ